MAWNGQDGGTVVQPTPKCWMLVNWRHNSLQPLVSMFFQYENQHEPAVYFRGQPLTPIPPHSSQNLRMNSECEGMDVSEIDSGRKVAHRKSEQILSGSTSKLHT